MLKIRDVALACSFYFFSLSAHSEPPANVNWFHCPHVDEITNKKNSSDLEAHTTIEGVTIHWKGWLQSKNPPVQFLHVYLEGVESPWFISCYYKDEFNNYGILSPLYGEYRSDGKTMGNWSEKLCRHNDPSKCLFSVIKNSIHTHAN